MRLFRKGPGPVPPRPRLQDRLARPWDRPETEFPGIVPINALQFGRSGQAAAAITGIWAYTSGFEFFVTRLMRPGVPGFHAEVPDGRGGMRLAREPFQVSLQFSDGSKVVSGRLHGDAEPAGPILRLGGGGGTSHYQHSRWWAWPLPPSGPLEFLCQWPALGTGESQVGIDAQLILDAARRSVQLWPEDEA